MAAVMQRPLPSPSRSHGKLVLDVVDEHHVLVIEDRLVHRGRLVNGLDGGRWAFRHATSVVVGPFALGAAGRRWPVVQELVLPLERRMMFRGRFRRLRQRILKETQAAVACGVYRRGEEICVQALDVFADRGPLSRDGGLRLLCLRRRIFGRWHVGRRTVAGSIMCPWSCDGLGLVRATVPYHGLRGPGHGIGLHLRFQVPRGWPGLWCACAVRRHEVTVAQFLLTDVRRGFH
mmetsp:Transcript_25223/g.74029  ORF Transcript_25223/g.74029 Transcript_25223/m.74029 type:complete len:233 (+) Transcript_25223:280-978(+)